MGNIGALKIYLKKNWLIVFVLVGVISIGTGVRFSLLEKHFSHIDDIGVAVTIIDRQAYVDNIEDRYENWRIELLNGEKGDDAKNIAQFLDNRSILKNVAYFGVWWRSFLHAVPSGWTYAPGQFYLTNFLVNSEQNYSEAKFWGRMPSSLFNIAGIGLFFLFLIRVYKNHNPFSHALIAATILSFSWENIIYSSQMENYAVSIFAMAFLFHHLLYIIKSPIISNKKLFLRGVLLALPGLFQYQALFFIPPIYLATLWFAYSKISLLEIVKATIFSILGFLSIFLLFIWPYLKGDFSCGINESLIGVKSCGITWNAGINKEFVLDPSFENGLVDFFLYVFNFFISNTPKVIEAMISPVGQFAEGYSYLGIVILAFCIGGLISMFLSNQITKKIIAIFISISIFFWIILLFLQVFPFSPTRHSMVLGPIFILLFIEGIFGAARLLNLSFFNMQIGGLTFIPLIFIMLWSGLFLSNIEYAIKNRTDVFNESSIYKLLNRDKIDVILVLDSTLQLYLMPLIITNFPALDANAWTFSNSVEISNYGKDDDFLKNSDSLRVAVLSAWSCFNPKSDLDILYGVLSSRYKLKNEKAFHSSKIIGRTCSKSDVEVEWSNLTSNGRNNFNYTVIDLF